MDLKVGDIFVGDDGREWKIDWLSESRVSYVGHNIGGQSGSEHRDSFEKAMLSGEFRWLKKEEPTWGNVKIRECEKLKADIEAGTRLCKKVAEIERLGGEVHILNKLLVEKDLKIAGGRKIAKEDRERYEEACKENERLKATVDAKEKALLGYEEIIEELAVEIERLKIERLKAELQASEDLEIDLLKQASGKIERLRAENEELKIYRDFFYDPDTRTIKLSERAGERLLEILDNPKEPNEELKKIMREHAGVGEKESE